MEELMNILKEIDGSIDYAKECAVPLLLSSDHGRADLPMAGYIRYAFRRRAAGNGQPYRRVYPDILGPF